jgi:hypothetical protein
LPRFWLVPFAVVVLLAGCTGPQIESPYFGPPGAIERAIRLYHERHASEGGGRCFQPYIDGFTNLTVIEDTPDRLVVDARYFWRDRFQQGGQGEGGQNCAGFNERTFTLAHTQDRSIAVVGMTGERDEPAIRSLIRRALPR